MTGPWRALARGALFLALLLTAGVAQAQVTVSFHSFNGSFFGRYPHAFVVFSGTLESTGEPVNENYGYSAKSIGPGILLGPVKQAMYTEKQDYIGKTNNHFTIAISDATYRRMKEEVALWRDDPEMKYDLDTRNCIHFVGAIAVLAGLKVDYPKKLLRKPRAWLNHIAEINPQLGAKQIK